MSKFKANVRQTGWIGSAIFGVVCVGILLIWAAGFMPASQENVQAVVQSAQGNAEATAIVTSSLEKTPTPTITELGRIKDKVNEALVLETAKQVTGNPALKSHSQIQKEEFIKDQQAIQKTFSNDVVSWTVKGIVGCVLLLIALNAFNSYRRSKH